MILTVQPADPIVTPRTDGTGFDVRTAYSGHHANLVIGNVSIAFDGRNEWRGDEDSSATGVVMQFAEYHDSPVRLDNVDCPRCDDVAETILFALAADLGYTLSK